MARMISGIEMCTNEDIKSMMQNLEIDIRSLRSMVDGLYKEESE